MEFAVKCVKNENFDFDKKITSCCDSEFMINNDDIYEINDVNYFGEELEDYYAICPNCGYMVLIDDSLLSDDIKNCAKDKNNSEMYLYKKNKLRSEIINLNYLEKNNRVKVRKK